MKREIYIYSILGVFTCLLIFYQFNFKLNETGNISSKIKSITNIDQLLINVNCNIFIVEGEDQNILLEGPDRKIRQIQAVSMDDCISISREKETFPASILGIFNLEKNDINIYITINDFDNIRISTVDELNNIKYTSAECMGLILSRGQKLLIESKFIKSCV
jgi:hypothetical protein